MSEILRRKSTGTPGNGGKFDTVSHDEAVVSVVALSNPILIDDDGFVTIPGDPNSPIARITVERDEDGTWIVDAEQPLNLLDYVPLSITGEEAREEWLNKRAYVIQEFIRDRYDAIMVLGEWTWDDMWITHRAHVNAPALTEEDAFKAAWDQTNAVKLYNEADHGTYGTENFGRLMNEFINERSVAVPPWRHKEVTDRDIDVQVSFRSGEREISDQVAGAIAARVTVNGTYDALSKLAMEGFARKDDISKDIVDAYSKVSPRERSWLDMLGTWNIHGGDNN